MADNKGVSRQTSIRKRSAASAKAWQTRKRMAAARRKNLEGALDKIERELRKGDKP